MRKKKKKKYMRTQKRTTLTETTFYNIIKFMIVACMRPM